MFLSIFMDVEDPIGPHADDAALDLARLFADAGVRGSFCVTGEKCRVLAQRGRLDVAEALRPHCLGLHTDTHSVHPTTMERLAPLDYESGCRAAIESEGRGFDAFTALFGRPPAFWGGAGNTWSPEVAAALAHYGIPAYAYALTALPDHAVHRFDGRLALPQALSVSEAAWTAGAAGPDLAAIRRPWTGIFVGHPTRLRHTRFWDEPYARGAQPDYPEAAPLASDADYRRALDSLHGFLRRAKRECEVVGVDEALALPWSYRPLDPDERRFFEEATSAAIRSAAHWPIHREGLDVEPIVAKTLALAHTVEAAFLRRP